MATALRGWLPNVIQSIEPWTASEDIDAGKRWSGEIADQLEASRFGIVCVTPENMAAPWILFESGALAKTVKDSNVVPYLFGMNTTDLTGPLSQFQAKLTDRGGTLEILRAINKLMGVLPEDRLTKAFDRWWPDLEQNLKAIPVTANQPKAAQRSERNMVEELVELARKLVNMHENTEVTLETLDTKISSLVPNTIATEEIAPTRTTRAAVLKCPCGKVNRSGAGYCANCGTSLAPRALRSQGK